jgi:hypothetical protein
MCVVGLSASFLPCSSHSFILFIIIIIFCIALLLTHSLASSCRTRTLAGGVLLTKDLIGMMCVVSGILAIN